MRALISMTCGAALLLSLPTLAAAQGAKEDGPAIFVSQKCSLCHSIAGKGNPKGPLDSVGATNSAAEIKQWLTDAEGMRAKTKATRTPAMKTPKLAPEQLDTMVAYLQTLKAA